MRGITAILVAVIVVGGAWFIYEESQNDVEIEFSEDGISIDD